MARCPRRSLSPIDATPWPYGAARRGLAFGIPTWLSLALVGAASLAAIACSDSNTNTNNGNAFDLFDTTGGGGTLDTNQPDTAGPAGDVTPSDDAATTADTALDTGEEDTGGATADVGGGGVACTKSSACKEAVGKPWCNVQEQQCVECLLDFHCKDSTGHCENNVCKAVSCVPGSAVCKGSSSLQVCKPDGKSFEVQPCPNAAPSCDGGKCRFCVPNSLYCQSPEGGVTQSTVAMQCNAQGNDSDIVQICSTGQVCSEGKCIACVPQDKKCLGNKSVVCKDDGSGYEVSYDCDAAGQVCLGGFCVDPCSSDFKANTNVGCDYFAVDLDNALVPAAGGKVYDAQNAQFSVIVSNTKSQPALVTVSTGDGLAAKYKVEPNALKIINLPDPLWKIAPLNQDGTNINAKSYRIQSNLPIVAYQFNPLQNFDVFSNDASLLLPSNAVGKEYWVMSRQQTHAALRAYLTIVAVSNGKTTVEALVNAKTLANLGGAQPIPAGPWLGKKTFLLERGQVLNIETDQNGADLTGSWIKADQPIAVFGGSEASNAPDTNKCVKPPGAPKGTCQVQGWDCLSNEDCPVTCCADHLEEQLFPVTAWGKMYIAAKLKPRGAEKDVWRVLAATNGTVVQTSPLQTPIPTLNQGQWFEFESDKDFILIANHPIMVGHFMASSHAPDPNNDLCSTPYGAQKLCTTMNTQFKAKIACNKNAECPNIQQADDAKIGDPAFLIAIATEQYLDDYVFLVPNKYKENYVNIIAPMDAQVTIDGAQVAPGSFQQIPGAPWRVARLPIAQGAHRLKSPNKPVGLYVYGWDDYVSYGFPGGAKIGGAAAE